MIYTTLFNPSIDIIYELNTAEELHTFTDLKTGIYPAGKGVNCAKVISALGEEVTVVSIMPKNDRNRFNQYLEEKNIRHISYEISGNARINTTILSKSNSSVTHYNSISNKISSHQLECVKNLILANIKNDDYLVLSGSLNSNNLEFYKELIVESKNKNVKSIIDSRGEPFKYAISARPYIISPNEAELSEYYEEPIKGLHHLTLRGKRLVDSGIEKVFITLGEDGVIAITEDETIFCKPPEVEVIDTIGCGDAFLGGLIVAEKRNFSLRESCRLAVSCGASNATHIGPGEVDTDQIWKFMENVSITEL